jgi:DNA-binding winged helix-turn-helix (wHTH) protein
MSAVHTSSKCCNMERRQEQSAQLEMPKGALSLSLILLSTEGAFDEERLQCLLKWDGVRVVARPSTFLEAMANLEGALVDLILLSTNSSGTELDLFIFEVRRRGFGGPILQVADVPQHPVRMESAHAPSLCIGNFVIDETAHRVFVCGTEKKLRRKEFELLSFFCKHPLQLLSHKTLLESLWRRPEVSSDALRALIRNMRAKIETTVEPRYILSVRGLGYRFIPSPGDDSAHESPLFKAGTRGNAKP